MLDARLLRRLSDIISVNVGIARVYYHLWTRKRESKALHLARAIITLLRLEMKTVGLVERCRVTGVREMG